MRWWRAPTTGCRFEFRTPMPEKAGSSRDASDLRMTPRVGAGAVARTRLRRGMNPTINNHSQLCLGHPPVSFNKTYSQYCRRNSDRTVRYRGATGGGVVIEQYGR